MSQGGGYSRANVTHFVLLIYRGGGGEIKLHMLIKQFHTCLVKNIEIQDS